MKDFNEYISKEIVRKRSPNKERADSLIEDSDKRRFFFNQIIEKIEINDSNANYIIEQVYDILIELIRAKTFLDGYEASGNYAHEAEVSYLKEINFSELERNTMDNIRKFRNGIKYYGRRYAKNEAEESIKFMNSILPKLKKLLKDGAA